MADALGTPGPPAGPGVVSALDHRLDQAGMIASQGAGMDVRTGVLAGPGTTALVTGTAATGTMTVSVAPHHWVSSRGVADGVYLGAVEAGATVTIAAAPGSNSRIDVIYVKQNDQYSTVSADASSAMVVDKVTGTAAVSPTKPALPVGALELGTVTVAAGATATNGAGVTITNTARQTVARGGILPVANATERTALSTAGGAYDGLVVEERNTDRLWLHTGSAWRYLGGGPPPTFAAAIGSGWTAGANRFPVAYLDGSGIGHLQGQVVNSNTFTPSGGQALFNLPAGVPGPPAGLVVDVPVINVASGGFTRVICTLSAAGVFAADNSGGVSIGAGSGWYLDSINWHTTQPATQALT